MRDLLWLVLHGQIHCSGGNQTTVKYKNLIAFTNLCIIYFYYYLSLTHWHLELFAKIGFFFYISVVLKLDRGQISFSLVENALVARQLAVLATRIAFKTFWPRHAQKSKFWESDLRLKAFRLLNFFSPFLSILGFVFLLLWLAISRACLGLKKISGRVIEVANFYHGAARCSGRKFGSEFFAQLFEHIWAY